MTPGRWRLLEDLYDAVRDLTPSERNERLKDADPEIRSHLEAILTQDGSVLEHPAWEVHASLLQTAGVIAEGAQLGPYKIEHPIGAGGMGEVYRAMDTRLGRAVALKRCRAEFSERFQREARTIASLNHPHICSIYDVGPDYLVMELLDGETLATKLKRGKFPVEQSLLWCRQIADSALANYDVGPADKAVRSSFPIAIE
jgi:eukaryotic-like serine/threonine-protein kinase